MKGSHSAVLAVAALAHSVAGHAFFQQAGKGATDYGTKCTRLPVRLASPDSQDPITNRSQLNNSPVSDVTSSAMACNVNGATGVAGICDAAGMPPSPFPCSAH
jgi:hypothetical protein